MRQIRIGAAQFEARDADKEYNLDTIESLARTAAGEGAEVHYTDASAGNAGQAATFFERAGVADRIHIHVGDALTSLGKTTGEFDFVFNDVDKQGYLDVLAAVPVRLSSGGLFVSDNALWHERVLNPPDQDSRNIVEFNRKLFASKEFTASLVPLRDRKSVV